MILWLNINNTGVHNLWSYLILFAKTERALYGKPASAVYGAEQEENLALTPAKFPYNSLIVKVQYKCSLLQYVPCT